MVFDIKVENFHRKAQLGGGRPYDPFITCYYFLKCVYKKNIHITLTMAVLHDLELKISDLLNACVMAPNRENNSTRFRVL